MNVILVYLVLSVIAVPCFSQDEVNPLRLESFDSAVFSSDSSLEGLFQVEEGELHGYTVGFDSLQIPYVVGQYKKGKKHGKWLFRDGDAVVYKRGRFRMVQHPGCGTGKARNKWEFNVLTQNLYEDHK